MNGGRLDLRHHSCSSARHVVWFSVAVTGLQSWLQFFFSSLEVNSDCRVDVLLDLRQLIEINSARHVAPFCLAVPELKLEFGSRIGGLC